MVKSNAFEAESMLKGVKRIEITCELKRERVF